MEDLEKQKLLEEIAMLRKKLTSGGRPHILTDQQINRIEQYRSEGKTVREIAEIFNCSMSTINRALRKLKNKQLENYKKIQKLNNENHISAKIHITDIDYNDVEYKRKIEI